MTLGAVDQVRPDSQGFWPVTTSKIGARKQLTPKLFAAEATEPEMFSIRSAL